MRTLRSVVRAVGVGLVVGVTAAGLSGAAAVAGPVTRAATSTCQFPHGQETVRGEVSATFPESVRPGHVVPVGSVAMSVVLPEPLVDSLRANGVVSVSGTVGIELTARDGQRTRDVAVRPKAIPNTVLPESGELRLRVDAEFPPVTVDRPGEVVFDLQGVTSALKVHARSLSSDVTCSADPGQSGRLATVPVTEDAPAPGDPSGGYPDPRAAAGLPVGYWVENTVTRIAKLQSNLSVGRGRFDALASLVEPYPITGDVTMPPSDGYFVTFRFMPTTSRVELIQAAETTGNLKGVEFVNGDIVGNVDTTIKLTIRLKDVLVDGVPLNVGPACQTAQPASIRIRGKLVFRRDPQGVPPTDVKTTFAIPPFTGCGVTEDLNPLMTGMVSGPNNEMSTTLRLRCFDECPGTGGGEVKP